METSHILAIDAARKMANEYVMQVSDDVEIYDDPIVECQFGWVFGYQSKRYIQTGHILDALAGNAPILIDKNKASLHVLGTAHPIEYYLKNYLNFGDPHKIGGSKVELVGR
ncbi:MAG: YrhB domain-containing protein [Roseobacter sp.]